MTSIPQFLIAAPSSNSGKTTVTQGLLRIFKNNGLSVQAFKCGPDYLDTKHHAWASGNVSINLDTFMSSEKYVQELYQKYSQNKDVSVVEGVMGLFDGAKKMKGSSAEIAERLNIPVILVVNAKATAYSVAPLLYGFKNFYKDINLAGVIFNFVSGESHYQFLKDACEDVGVEALGYVKKNEEISLPSRHLGLQISSTDKYEDKIEQIASHINETVNVERLMEITCKDITVPDQIESNKKGKLKIAVAKDEAFNFTYHENLKALEKLGNIEYFSPIRDQKLPEADLLYFAGGYPELYLKELSKNTKLKSQILNYCENGGKVLAECGGMMYLSDSIVDKESNKYPMIGFFKQSASMENMKLHLGYRKINLNGVELFGHEFHYSHLNGAEENLSIGEVYSARGKKLDTHIFKKKNTIASYIHFYGGEIDLIKVLFD
ncbi:cobyrinate a,c-diamide synthase [Marinifilum sp. N1E240]|uniref:cobyrinate a,c-diamide synthase n=1 Tax=Marinifilum sp. N1E240 TaxID=2608082 RepID=UPI00128DBB73|nr:cobyrinate a,c-diamide synthase [Marinifilum sp. N1E240]MPQ47038.1 cobyrinate a,c-diamide synthase [Marinifilum sp. N1E240]